MTPIIIPLAPDPTGTYIELRYTLRSIQKHYKDKALMVIIVGEEIPDWLKNVHWGHCPNAYPHKDADMIHKILTGIQYMESLGHSGTFTKFSDDAILLGNYYPAKEKPKYFCPMASTLSRLDDGLWKQRFERTMDYLKDAGIEDPLNFDTHTPQPYDSKMFRTIITSVNYAEDIGYVLNSLYFNLAYRKEAQVPGVCEQITIDLSCPSRLAMIKAPLSSVREAEQATYRCRFLETDQAAFVTPAFEKWLKIRFPKKSIFEG